jgi:hypothetical protein
MQALKKPKRIQHKKIGEQVLHTLDLLNVPQWGRLGNAPGVARRWDFDTLQPFILEDGIQDEKAHIIRNDLWFTDLDAPLDSRIMVLDNEYPERPAFVRFKWVTPRDVRGKLVRLLPIMIEKTMVFFNEGLDKAQTGSNVFGRRQDGVWIPLNSRLETYVADYEMESQVQLHIGLQFLKESQWRVYISYGDSPGIEIPTDPVGAQAVFRLRDLPDNAARRKALRHWVDEHWRQIRDDPTVETKVRTHLRGGAEFSWNGLHCRIIPSRTDTVLAALAKADREDMTLVGADRRVAGETIEYTPPWWIRALKLFRLQGRKG